jgi:hypothetical protein
MTRRFLNCIWLIVILSAAQVSLRAEMTNNALLKSVVLENDVAYLRVGNIEKNLSEEIQSAQTALSATNKIDGTILDLRFADGDDSDSAKAMENLIIQENLPLAILVNSRTRGAAAKLAMDLRMARAGLIFGGATKNLQPDISISVNVEAEKSFLENPFGTLSQSETNSSATNNFLSFVDHTSEADLVRAKIKDGEEDGSLAPERPTEPQKPFIRDPVLARAVDLIKGLAIVRQSRS